MVFPINTESLLSGLWSFLFDQLFLCFVCVCPLMVVTVTRKCVKWGQLLVIGSADSLEMSSTTIGHLPCAQDSYYCYQGIYSCCLSEKDAVFDFSSSH